MSQHTPEPEAAAAPPHVLHDTAPAADRAGHVEQHGIDVIPPSDRHGRPRELFWVWMSANVNYLYFVLGGGGGVVRGRRRWRCRLGLSVLVAHR